MNVFVLNTGRCGSTSFAKVCEHIDNYTAGHETLVHEVGPARFAYPDQHIEADNRLSWMLGSLGRHFDDDGTLYVHLTRNPEEVVSSFLHRWDSPFRSSAIRAFGHGIVIRAADWSERERLEVCRSYVETITHNIEDFLRDRPSMVIDIADLSTRFADFADRIDATYDVDAAASEMATHHNAR